MSPVWETVASPPADAGGIEGARRGAAGFVIEATGHQRDPASEEMSRAGLLAGITKEDFAQVWRPIANKYGLFPVDADEF
jgi:hypothetical protein